MSEAERDPYQDAIAIIGMACRFPGARNLEELWRNLAAGVESIRFFSREELAAAGVPEASLADPNYVRASPVLDDVDLFDAAFFDFSPREAEVLDPQHRVFLEVAWEALERAGQIAAGEEVPVGVYAGCSISTYLFNNVMSNREVLASVGTFQAYLSNDRDYFPTRVSYKLNLRGPSINVQTACSTSLVAVHLACQSLLDYHCDVALAGGIRVSVPMESGYSYQPGGIVSPDGHCRSFDAKGEGSVFGSGAGAVVLKRYADAVADGDPIDAVVLGTALNNDGSHKVGYTAPSLDGQAEVIAMAHAVAGVHPEEITLIEAHGSGTPLGDPIEVAALTEAFRAGTEETGYCAVGSVKSNFGHLEAAAGVAGLIKAVLALKHRQIPPSLHVEELNPKIDFATSPFYVARELADWPAGEGPRRAGVSSFGIGGTNAHVIVEEAPEPEAPEAARPYQLLTLSARSPEALEAATDNLAAYLEEHPDEALADVAWTLATGRRAFEHRRTLVATDGADAARALAGRDPRRLATAHREPGQRPLTFLFSGLGDHYVGMARGLYEAGGAFRRELDACSKQLRDGWGMDLPGLLYPEGVTAPQGAPGAGGGMDFRRLVGRGGGPGEGEAAKAHAELGRTAVAQPALFALQLALARQWQEWGMEPESLIGYSLGEYVAATVAGVLSPEDALTLVVERSRLIDELSAGGMLAVPLAAEELARRLPEELAVAAVNGPEVAVAAGPAAAVDELERRLTEEGLLTRRLATGHAFHSPGMETLAPAVTELAGRLTLRAPEIPYLSNVTGTWITDEEAVDPAYWARHLCRPVEFAAAVAELWEEPQRVFLEVGPGQALGALVLQHPACPAGAAVIPSLRAAHEGRDDEEVLLSALGQLWLAGIRPHWPSVWGGERRRRLVLPTYPFQHRRYWLEPGGAAAAAGAAVGAAAGAAGAAGAAAPQAGEGAAAGTGAGAPAIEGGTLTFHPRPALTTPYVAPESELERQIAAVWQQVLGVAEVGVYDDFFRLGGHSLLAPRLLMRLGQELGVPLPMRLLFEAPTVREMVEMVERARREGVEAVLAEAEEVDFAAEAVLDEAVQVASERVEDPFHPRTVLLTGASGFVGAYLAGELLRQTEARILCLVRAEDEAAAGERLEANLRLYRQWSGAAAERLVPVAGDLAEPAFGLGEERFTELAGQVDAVYHAGAWVNFTYPYQALKGANVHGTREALRLAGAVRKKPFHFVSSIAVFAAGSLTDEGWALEDSDLPATQGLFSGYAETKWVAERLVRAAEERGIPVTVHRPGVVGGHSETGVGNTRDLVWNLFKGSIQLGGAMRGMGTLDVMPVDAVARTLVALSLDPESLGKAYHYPNPETLPWDEAFREAAAMGYALELQPGDEWMRRLQGVAQRGEDNALLPFLPMLSLPPPESGEGAEGEVGADETQGQEPRGEEPQGAHPESPGRQARHDGTHTWEGAARLGIDFPPVSRKLVRTYLEYFVESGFLPPPPGEGGNGGDESEKAAVAAEAES